MGEAHLRHVIGECALHYHLERPLQGISNRFIEPCAANTNAAEGAVRRRVRLGGVLSYYYRDVVNGKSVDGLAMDQ